MIAFGHAMPPPTRRSSYDGPDSDPEDASSGVASRENSFQISEIMDAFHSLLQIREERQEAEGFPAASVDADTTQAQDTDAIDNAERELQRLQWCMETEEQHTSTEKQLVYAHSILVHIKTHTEMLAPSLHRDSEVWSRLVDSARYLQESNFLLSVACFRDEVTGSPVEKFARFTAARSIVPRLVRDARRQILYVMEPFIPLDLSASYDEDADEQLDLFPVFLNALGKDALEAVSEVPSDFTCSICLCDRQEVLQRPCTNTDDRLVRLRSCQHTYCKSCLWKWIERSDVADVACPQCRSCIFPSIMASLEESILEEEQK